MEFWSLEMSSYCNLNWQDLKPQIYRSNIELSILGHVACYRLTLSEIPTKEETCNETNKPDTPVWTLQSTL